MMRILRIPKQRILRLFSTYPKPNSATYLDYRQRYAATWSADSPRGQIYSEGKFLRTVQMAKIYEDSKKVVDMKMKYPAHEIMDNFEDFMRKFDDTPSTDDVRHFVEENFEPGGKEFVEWIPSDWVENPRFLERINNPDYKYFIYELNAIWRILGRKLINEIHEDTELYSIMYTPNPVIVPGGRFTEFYYWDSYWIIRGLLLCDMLNTVRGMLRNFMYIVDNFGLIPNGGRVYYLTRSQPPLFIPMVYTYFEHTGDLDFLDSAMGSMEREFDYWMKNHTVTVNMHNKDYTLARYFGRTRGPRPESYAEDVESASVFDNEEDKEAHYAELRAGAESGWDFSSRWIIMGGTNRGFLRSIKTRSIIPVDLNSYVYWCADILKECSILFGEKKKIEYYSMVADEWKEAVNTVLWHDKSGIWLDYDIHNSIQRKYFYLSNVTPLFVGCYDRKQANKIVSMVLQYLKRKHVLAYPGGTPTSIEHSGEQWDFPNAWPPLQHILAVGLHNTGNEKAQKVAKDLAKRWIDSNLKAYKDSKGMYEKYDCRTFGGYGGGGEYEIQLGFGWTNGVVMDLIDKFFTDQS